MFGIPIPPLWMIFAGLFGISTVFGVVQTHRLGNAQDKIAAVDAVGQAQEKATKLQTERDRKEKERADNEAKRRFADLDARYKRLLNGGTSVLPAPAPGAGSGDRVCFARDALGRSLSEFIGGSAGLLAEGDRGIIAAEIAKSWATAPSRVP